MADEKTKPKKSEKWKAKLRIAELKEAGRIEQARYEALASIGTIGYVDDEQVAAILKQLGVKS